MNEITSIAELSEIVKAHRVRQAITQDELARSVGVTRSAISCFESKKSFRKFDDLLTLIRALGLKIYLQ